jgi:hypothetical protein
MNTGIRLAVVASLIVAGIGIAAAPVSAHPDPVGPPAPSCSSCPSYDTLVMDLRAQGFTPQAANVFVYLIRQDGCYAAS